MRRIKLGDFAYILKENSECYCSGVSDYRKRYRGVLSIPETIYYEGETYTVTEIYSESFRGAKIESISFPSSIKGIGNFCFTECDYLDNITIPSTIKCIGHSCFSGCSKLNTVKLENETITILPRAFTSTPYFQQMFSSCKDNGCVYLGSSLVNIGDNCETVITKPGTKAITIPTRRPLVVKDLYLTSTIEYLDISKFITIENIYVDSIESYFEIDIISNLRRLGVMRNLYVNNKLVTDLIVPDNLRSISRSHISGLSINTIKISEHLKRIDSQCFSGCKNLKSITLPGPTFIYSDILAESGIKRIMINQDCRFVSEALYSPLDIIIRLDGPIKTKNQLLFENINLAFKGGVVKPDIVLLLVDDSPKTIESVIEALSKSNLKNLVIHLPEEMLSANYSVLATKFYLDFRIPDHLLEEFSRVFPRSIKYSSLGYKGFSSDLEYFLDGNSTVIVPKLNKQEENQYKGIIKIPSTYKNVKLHPFAFSDCKELEELICSEDIIIGEDTFFNSGNVIITRIKNNG